jgi:hypothetical protein
MTHHKILASLLFTFCLGLCLPAQMAPRYLALPQHPPLVERDFRRPGFWISRHPAPDSLIMDNTGIERFNHQVVRKGDLRQLEAESLLISRDKLIHEIQQCFSQIRKNGNFDAAGQPLSAQFWSELEAQLNLKAIPASSQPRYGYPIRFTNQRLAPHSGIISSGYLDLEFDYLQNSGFDIGSPVILYHESRDGKWLFAAGRASSGWVWKEDIAIMDREDWLAYQQAQPFVITLAEKSDLYRDASRTDYYALIRMGNRLPLIAEDQDSYELLLPGAAQQSVFIAKRDAHQGYLPYTARNVYEQAFKAQNTPYGWGDLNAEYDCSGLIKQLFQCFGIYLPRNGAEQYKAGLAQAEFSQSADFSSRAERLAGSAIPAATLLRLPGHIMLYLGRVEGKAYVLHSLWGIRRPNDADGADEIIAVNHTVVSDLSLGAGSSRGSLLDRLSGFAYIFNQ